MKIIDFPQGSAEWFASRAGKVTASCISDVMAKIKTGEAASRADYKAQIVAEILTGKPQGSTFTNEAMQWGTEQEPFARATYEIQRGVIVQEVGFIHHPTIAMSGASPDGLVDDGLVEIKCPNTATHIDFLLTGKIPNKYVLQMAWQMLCTGRKWCDYVSFDPRMPERMRIKVMRVIDDEVLSLKLETEVLKFNGEIEQMVSDLNQIQDTTK